jgi:hypothetical protein
LEVSRETDIFVLELLSAQFLQQVIYLISRVNLVIDVHLLIQSARVRDDPSDIASHVPDIGQCAWHISIEANRLIWLGSWENIVNAARRETRKRDLVPPANVDICVRKANFLDIVQVLFFLGECQRGFNDNFYTGSTFSRKSTTPLGGTTIIKADWTNRFTPATFAALARGISSPRLPKYIAEMTTSIPERACTSFS